jgi:hypothetical protein
MPLPATPERWQKRFAAFLNENEETADWRYPEAASCRLCISAGELGEYSIRFHRDVQPVRWQTRREDGRVQVRLLDETGLEGPAGCEVFGMLSPLTAIPTTPADVATGFLLAAPGALVFARHGDHQEAVIVSAGLARDGLQGLGVRPDASEVTTGRVSLANAIRTLSLWLGARLVGPLAEIRRQQVTSKIVNALYAKMCGSQWAGAEETFRENPAAPSSINALQHKVYALDGFAAAIRRDHLQILAGITSSNTWYRELAQRYSVCKDAELCEFAVRLAIFPQSLPKRFESSLEKLGKRAVADPAAIRGARFAALLCSQLAPEEMGQFLRKLR